MKREILCLSCHSARVASAGINLNQTYEQLLAQVVNPPESKKYVKGRLSKYSLCDACNKGLEPGDEAVAVSTWIKATGGCYTPWESEYLEVTS